MDSKKKKKKNGNLLVPFSIGVVARCKLEACRTPDVKAAKWG
jgi:hypothetical protein